MHYHGNRVAAKDGHRAADYFTMAATKGHAAAANALAEMYEDGEFLPTGKNIQRSLEYFKIAGACCEQTCVC